VSCLSLLRAQSVLNSRSKNGDLTIVVNGRSDRILRRLGNHAFFPAGAPAVRVKFTNTGSEIHSLAAVDHVLVLAASRTPWDRRFSAGDFHAGADGTMARVGSKAGCANER
jgi:hypothetical protein